MIQFVIGTTVVYLILGHWAGHERREGFEGRETRRFCERLALVRVKSA